MTDQELRLVVREALARHLTPPEQGSAHAAARPATTRPDHVSHAVFALTTGRDAGGPCIIEPAVSCNHCGYCKSYGH